MRRPPRPLSRRAFLGGVAAAAAALALPRRAGALGDASRLSIGHVQHGGSWNPRPSALRRLGWELSRRTSIETTNDAVAVRLDRPGLHLHPFLYLSGSGAMPPLREEERDALRRHLQYGGFLLVDAADGSDGGGFDASVRRELAKVLPSAPLQPVPRDHVLHKSFYLLDRQGGRVLVKPWVEAQIVDGRLAVVYTQNDLGGAWARTELGDWEYPCTPGGEPQRETAIRLGVNLAMYALCTDYKDDAVHLPFILRRRSYAGPRVDAAYNDWRLTALTPLPLWALALLAAAAVAAVWLAHRGLRGEPRRGRRAALLALRAVSALLALFLLVEPALELLQTARVRNRFAVLVDASRSMGFPIEADGPSRSVAAGKLLADERGALDTLSDRVDVEWFAFGGDVAPADPAQVAKGLPPRAGATDVLGALKAVASGAGGSTRRLAGALVVSDGADNAALAEGLGPEARAELRALGVPVNTVAVGRAAPRDLAVERVAVDDFAFVRNTVTVEATIRARGFADEEVRLVLRREGAVVASSVVRLERGKDRYTVPLSFAPDATGTFVFTVAAPVFPGEAVAENNARSFVLRVIRDRVRVLLVAGRPSWDVRFLRGLLKQDPNVDLVSFFILRSNADDPGPQQELSLIPFPVQEIFGDQLRTFDAVLFVNFAYAPYRGLEIERFLPNLRDYVRNGGALAMVGGEQSFGDGRYGETPLGEVLPVAPVDGTSMAEGELRPRLTGEGRRHPVTSLAPGEGPNDAAWAGLPAVTAVNLTRALPRGAGAAVLLEAPGLQVGGSPAPVVAVREVGQGRTLAVTTDASWRWGFLAAEGGQGNRAYIKFWNSALRWLVRDPGLAPLQVEPEAPAVEPGAPVGVSISARGPDWGPAAGRRVSAELVAEDGRTVSRAEGVADADGAARLELAPPGPGAYKIVARGDGSGAETATAAVAVRGAGPEDADAAPRPDLLGAISDATGGRASAIPGGGLPNLQLADPEVVEIGRRKAVPIWDRWWYLGALAVALSAEWILRRRWGYW